MFNIMEWDLVDFNYNGKWLSDFEGMVIDVESIPIFPDIDFQTEDGMYDGELGVLKKYKSRKLTLPILLTNINKYFEFTGWLNIKEPLGCF